MTPTSAIGGMSNHEPFGQLLDALKSCATLDDLKRITDTILAVIEAPQPHRGAVRRLAAIRRTHFSRVIVRTSHQEVVNITRSMVESCVLSHIADTSLAPTPAAEAPRS